MTVLSVSTLSLHTSLTSILQSQQAQLDELTVELSTQQKHTDLTDYSASDARNLINIQSGATQKQAYLSVISTVSNNLSVYDTTLTDLETIASQAQSLANDNPTYSSSTATLLATQASSYLKSVGVDLDQQVDGRYIYSGTRYNTAPVGDLSTLPTSTLSSAVYTDNSTLPSYDSGYAAGSVTLTTSGQTVTVGGTVAAGQNASVTVNGTTYSYAVQSTDTPTSIASGLAALVPGASSSGGNLTIAAGDTINNANSSVSGAAAYTTDSATIDTGDTVNYGITSNNPAIQKLVAGLRYLQAAGNATDSATYSANVTKAASLLTSAVTSLQSLHTTVADNTNLMTTEKAKQTSAVTDLTNQLQDIQGVDVTQVSAEITSMQTILQASYLVTGDLEKMSIVSYL